MSALTAGPALASEPPEDPPIVVARSESANYFHMEDGIVKGEFHTEAVNYRDSDGVWRPINSSLVPDGSGAWKNFANDFAARFAASGASPDLVSLSWRGAVIQMRLVGGQPVVASVQGSVITYAGILPGVDLSFRVTSKGIEKSITLHERPLTAPVFRFEVRAAGLTRDETPEGPVFLNADGDGWVLPPAWMADNGLQGSFSSDVAVSLVPVETAGVYDVTVMPSLSWLQDLGRTYPVVIDPTFSKFSNTAGGNGYGDTFTQSDISTSQQNSTELRAGRTLAGVRARSYMKFDVTALSGYAPASAEFWIDQFDQENCVPQQLDLVKINSSWAWNIRWSDPWPSLDTANPLGTTSKPAATGPCPPRRYMFGTTANLNNTVIGWVNGSIVNNGMALFGGDTAPVGSTWKRFYSADMGVNRPTLVVYYAWKVPSLVTVNHPDSSVWYSNANPSFNWTAYDPNGILGYSYLLGSSTAEAPTTTPLADQSVSYTGKADGNWWFHLRFKNNAADPLWSINYSKQIRIDTAPPSIPTIASSSHSTTQASTEHTVRVDWNASTDPWPSGGTAADSSGLLDYRWAFTTSSAVPTVWDGFNDANTRFATRTLADGQYWFHVQARDRAVRNDGSTGNWSGDRSYGPITLGTPSIIKTASPTLAGRGQAITYTIDVSNSMSQPLAIPVVDDVIPSGLLWRNTTILTASPATTGTLQSCAAAGLTCGIDEGNKFTSANVIVAANSSRRFVFNVIAAGAQSACETIRNTASATPGTGNSTNFVDVDVCDTGLGIERWWTYASENLGPASAARVNVANGNLVIQQADSTPVQAHGRLAYSLKRTYNSQDMGLVTFPGSIGKGWLLDVAETGDLVGGGLSARGLSVPSIQSVVQPLAVTLVDRDGTRHVFSPRSVALTPFEVTSGSLDVLKRKDPTPISLLGVVKVCADVAYDAPKGVHLSLWRYVGLKSAAEQCSSIASAVDPIVLGFAAVRPDRVRYEFAATGQLLSLVDPAGVELRYEYDASPITITSRLKTVFEPAACADPYAAGNKCRALKFTYASDRVTVTDPAGRTTEYIRNASELLEFVKTNGVQLFAYTYGTCTGHASQVCSVTDPRGKVTRFTYAIHDANRPDRARVTKIKDRNASETNLIYDSSTQTTVNSGTAAQQNLTVNTYSEIDSAGRVKVVTEGPVATPLRRATYTWDGSNAAKDNSCRADNVLDNNLCSVHREALTGSSPSDEHTFTYNPEGSQLRDRHVGPASEDLTNGYSTQFWTSTGGTAYNDIPTGGGTVPVASRPSSWLFYVIDHTHSLTARGNAAGGSYAAYMTTYTRDAAISVAPNKALATSGACSTTGTATANSGVLCGQTSPVFDGATATKSWFTYDQWGQKATMRTPKAIAENAPAPSNYTYTYYTDSDLDLSGGVSAGGWLKAVADPTGKFVAFGYDRAGNVVREWDRNATAGKALALFPGTVSAPPANAPYAQTLYGSAPPASAFASPGRYVLSKQDVLGNTTTFTPDSNGNVLAVRPPRGTLAGNDSFDIVNIYDDNGNLTSTQTPMQRAEQPATSTTFGYNHLDVRIHTTDADGNITREIPDSIGRITDHLFTRGPWSTSPPAPSGCRQSTSGDAPIASGKILCWTTNTYNGLDEVISSKDASRAETTFTYNAMRRLQRRDAPRNDATYATLRTEMLYDRDGRVTEVCPPSHFAAGNSSCITSNYTTHSEYDEIGRLKSQTQRRNAPSVMLLTTSYRYDADGNIIGVKDPNTNGVPRSSEVTTVHDLLGRRQSLTTPRKAGVSSTDEWIYDAAGNVTAVKRPGAVVAERITAYRYDAANRLVETVAGSSSTDVGSAGVTDSYGGGNIRSMRFYDADGHVVAELEPRAFMPTVTPYNAAYMTRTDYDADGRPEATYSPRYATDATDLNLSGAQGAQCPIPSGSSLPDVIANVPAYPAGVGVCRTTTTYYPSGRSKSVTLPGGAARVLDYTWTEDGLLKNIEGPSPAASGGRVNLEKYEYDANGRTTRAADARDDEPGIDHASKATYFADGLLKEVTGEPGPAGTHVTSFTYDADGRPKSETDPEGKITESAYYSDGLLRWAEDGLNNRTSYEYDHNGNATKVTAPSTVAATNTFFWDNLLETTTAPIKADNTLKRVTTYDYDLAGRKTIHAIKRVDQNNAATPGRTQTFTYYASDRLATELGTGSGTDRTKTYRYDAAGNTTLLTETGAATMSATWYADNLLRTWTTGSQTTLYDYDALGNRTARADDCATCNKKTTYVYGDAGLPTSMTGNLLSAGSIAWTYDVGGRPKTETNPNGINLTYTYANDDTLTSLKIEKPASTTNTFTYTYDKNYRVKSQAFSGPGSGAGTPVTATFSYLYDDAGRLDSYTDNSGTQDVAYDVNGNRTTFGSLSWTYNADDSIASAKIPLGGLIGTIDRPYSYDPSGRLQNDGCQTSTYDAFDRLTSTATTAALNCPTGKLFGSYTYDALDRQLANPKDTAGSAIYDGNTQALLAGANNATYLLGPSGEPKGVAASATLTQYLHPDGQGNVGMTSNTTGGIACTSRFDPYGNAEPNDSILGGAAAACNTGTSTSEIFWRMTRQDGASGTYQFGARTYDPATATFLQTDTYRAANNGEDLSVGTDPLTRNTYSYVNGDPINLIDPSGHRAVSNDSNGQSDEQVAATMRRMANRQRYLGSQGIPSDYDSWTLEKKKVFHAKRTNVKLTCVWCMSEIDKDIDKGLHSLPVVAQVKDAFDSALRGDGWDAADAINELNPFAIAIKEVEACGDASGRGATGQAVGHCALAVANAVAGLAGPKISGRAGAPSRGASQGAGSLGDDVVQSAGGVFAHGYRYHPRIRARGVQDPVGHNFPYSFDDMILRTSSIRQADGSLLFRLAGSVNGKDGFFEIAVNPDTRSIFHRAWVGG
ncbi:MAG TPA: RHS repeat-associated core domain-containing protein [Actinomycetota bacterium]